MPASPAAALLALLSLVPDCGTSTGPRDEALMAQLRPGREVPGPRGQACPVDAIAIPAGENAQPIVDRAGAGAVFCLGAGVHRAQTIAPLARQHFHGAPGAILRGSIETAPFQQEGALFSAPAPILAGEVRGTCLPAHPACRSPAAVFVDGRPVPEVARRSDLEHGRFFFDAATGRIVTLDDWRGRRIEASAARFAFLAKGAADVVISDLAIEHYASPAQRGTVYDDTDPAATGWRIEHNDVRLNGGLGVLGGPGATVRANRISDNGQLGVGFSSPDVRVEDNVISGNNREGFDPAWEGGGLKGTQARGASIRGNLVFENAGPGLWCDIECRDVTYQSNLVAFNTGAGLFHEISFGALVENNVARCNGTREGWYWGAGILLASSSGVEVTGNVVVVADDGTGIAIVDQGRPRGPAAFYKAADNRIEGNVLRFEGTSGRMGAASDLDADSPNGGLIETEGNRFDANLYRVPPRFAGDFAWGAKEIRFDRLPIAGQERRGLLETDGPAEGALTR